MHGLPFRDLNRERMLHLPLVMRQIPPEDKVTRVTQMLQMLLIKNLLSLSNNKEVWVTSKLQLIKVIHSRYKICIFQGHCSELIMIGVSLLIIVILRFKQKTATQISYCRVS